MFTRLEFRRSRFAPSALAFTLLALPTTSFALDFATPGTVGTLTFKVKAEGGGRYKAGPGAGYDAMTWKIKNSGEFELRVKAVDPTGDTSSENMEKIGKVGDSYQKSISERDQEVMDKWEEKVDACNGNEACENRVRTQMFADPQYMRVFQKMQGAAPEMLAAGRAVNLEPRNQIWTNTLGTSATGRGKVQIDLVEQTFGVIDTGGGGKVDVTCRWAGNTNIEPGMDGSVIGATLIIDAKASTYEIQIPADALGMRVKESCRDSKDGAHGPSKNTRDLRVIGAAPAPGEKDFVRTLTFKGPVGSTRSPQFSGKKTVTTEWLSNTSPPRIPVKVTLEWHFSAGGR